MAAHVFVPLALAGRRFHPAAARNDFTHGLFSLSCCMSLFRFDRSGRSSAANCFSRLALCSPRQRRPLPLSDKAVTLVTPLHFPLPLAAKGVTAVADVTNRLKS